MKKRIASLLLVIVMLLGLIPAQAFAAGATAISTAEAFAAMEADGSYELTADITVMDLSKRWQVDPEKFYSMGRSTLFTGQEVQGEVAATYVGGRCVYDRETGIHRA